MILCKYFLICILIFCTSFKSIWANGRYAAGVILCKYLHRRSTPHCYHVVLLFGGNESGSFSSKCSIKWGITNSTLLTPTLTPTYSNLLVIIIISMLCHIGLSSNLHPHHAIIYLMKDLASIDESRGSDEREMHWSLSAHLLPSDQILHFISRMYFQLYSSILFLKCISESFSQV